MLTRLPARAVGALWLKDIEVMLMGDLVCALRSGNVAVGRRKGGKARRSNSARRGKTKG